MDSFNRELTGAIVAKGFKELLDISISDDDLTKLKERVFFVTMGVAQRIHELCETLALRVRDNGWRFSEAALQQAEKDWLRIGFRDSYVTVEGHLNNRRTQVSRKNQVIFAIGRCEAHQFDTNMIEELIREHFRKTIPASGDMGIGVILSELCKGDTPLLVRHPKTAQYRIRDPRFVMCIRLIIQKGVDGKVGRLHFQIG